MDSIDFKNSIEDRHTLSNFYAFEVLTDITEIDTTDTESETERGDEVAHKVAIDDVTVFDNDTRHNDNDNDSEATETLTDMTCEHHDDISTTSETSTDIMNCDTGDEYSDMEKLLHDAMNYLSDRQPVPLPDNIPLHQLNRKPEHALANKPICLPCDTIQEAASSLRSLAMEGNADAQYCLGRWCYDGTQMDANVKEAVMWFSRAVAQNHTPSMIFLGWCYLNGTGVVQNNQQAFLHFLTAAELGDSEAQYRVSLCFEEGCGVSFDREQARRWRRSAADQFCSAAQYNEGMCCLTGEENGTQNVIQAVRWFKKAADQGNAHAQYQLAKCYEESLGVERNYDLAIQSYIDAAFQHHVGAQFAIASWYERHIRMHDGHQAIRWYELAARQGHAEAQYVVGECYKVGRGVAQNDTCAMMWFQRSADLNFAPAQCRVGDFWAARHGLYGSDKAQAIMWYRKAAEQGFAEAQFQLGQCYRFGTGGLERSQTQAAVWYRRAAAQHHVGATYVLQRIKY